MKHILTVFLLSVALTQSLKADEPSAEDEIQRGYYESSPWDILPGGFNGTYHVSLPAGPTRPVKSATWSIQLPQANRVYRVEATWTANPENASNARFNLFDGKRSLKSVTVNQKRPPQGAKDGNSVFQELGKFLVKGTTLQVDLTNEGDGRVIADAVRVVP